MSTQEGIAEEPLNEEAALCVVDSTVAEIFEAMVWRRSSAVGSATGQGIDISAKISFSGFLIGHCIVDLPESAAVALARMLLNMEEDCSAATIDDVAGELCNMIAGGWKSKLSEPFSAARLSVPSVARGPLRAQTAEMPGRLYRFDDQSFEVRIAIESGQDRDDPWWAGVPQSVVPTSPRTERVES